MKDIEKLQEVKEERFYDNNTVGYAMTPPTNREIMEKINEIIDVVNYTKAMVDFL
jgi:hypothetical protein